MQNIRITEDKSIMIDVFDYLQRYEDRFTQARWSDDKLICCSPFRDDHSPSFFVNLDNEWSGTWGDSGSKESGNFIELLSRLEDIGYSEAADKLLDEFYIKPYEVPMISAKVRVKTSHSVLEREVECFSEYLESRGISQRTQSAYHTWERDGVVGFPYISGRGACKAIKYRQVAHKNFYYESGDNSLKEVLFGFHLVYEQKPSTIFICEAEIDAMSVYEKGFVAVSLGNARISDAQVELIIKASPKTVVLALDEDEAGRITREDLKKALKGHCDIYFVQLPEGNDINDYVTTHDALPPLSKVKNKVRKKIGGEFLWSSKKYRK